MHPGHDYFMDRALEQARASVASGGRPIFALVVQNGEIRGLGSNKAGADNDPSAHAEVSAIRDACSKLKSLDLTGCTLYSPLEPCPMCLGTILEARLDRLVLGARHARVGMKQHGNYTVEAMLALTGRPLDVVTGIREVECEALRIAWLQAR
jgi:tRNA(adenine34) deaminase